MGATRLIGTQPTAGAQFLAEKERYCGDPGRIFLPKRAQAGRLLKAYRQALALTADLPPSYQTRFGWLTRFLAWLRPEWGLSRFAVDHMRRRVDALSRRYCLRLALGEDDGNDSDDHAALERFEVSLPSAPSRLIVVVLPVVAVIVMAQVLFAAFGAVKEEQAAFEKLSALVDLNPSHFNAETLLHSDFLTVLDLIAVVTLSVYLVLRPFVSGFQLKRMIVGIPGAARGRRAGSPLARRADEIAVHAQERALSKRWGCALRRSRASTSRSRPRSSRAGSRWGSTRSSTQRTPTKALGASSSWPPTR